MKTIKDQILDEYKKGNIVYATFEGIEVANLQEFIKQPTDGILYDLNRSEEVVCVFLDDPKWLNDYACAKVIRALKDRIAELEDRLNSKNKIVEF